LEANGGMGQIDGNLAITTFAMGGLERVFIREFAFLNVIFGHETNKYNKRTKIKLVKVKLGTRISRSPLKIFCQIIERKINIMVQAYY
jgi:hypothetical protein